MRRFLLGIAAASLAASTIAAHSADLPLKAPPPVPGWSWDGFYAGVDGGYSAGRTQAYQSIPGIPFVGGDTAAVTFNGALFGAQAGFNKQFGHLVVGAEGDVQWTGEQGNNCVVICFMQANGEFDAGIVAQQLDWFATLRGRLGWANDGYLLFVTAGPAWGGVHTKNIYWVDTTPPWVADFDSVRSGLAAGFGIEARLFGNWTGKIEYLYLDFPGANSVLNIPGLFPVFANTGRLHDDIIRAGVNYQFGALPGTAPALYATARTAMRRWTWTGFYLGINGGYGAAADPTNQAIPNGGFGAFTHQNASVAPAGGLFGGQGGYNWQSGHVVFGVEADAQWTGQDGHTCGISCTSGGVADIQQKLQWFATGRGRIGWAEDGYLFYATGGGAAGRITETDIFQNVPASGTFTHTLDGWTAGLGAEAHLGGNLSGKIEYLHIGFGSTTNTMSDGAGGILVTHSVVHDDIFRAGLNYKLGG